jgi:hypothetical protein
VDGSPAGYCVLQCACAQPSGRAFGVAPKLCKAMHGIFVLLVTRYG